MGTHPIATHSRSLLASLLAVALAASFLVVGGGLGNDAHGQVEDRDCIFSIAPSAKGKRWWKIAANCEVSGWGYIDASGFGLRGSAPAGYPPACKMYAENTYGGSYSYQSHTCGPAGFGVLPDHPQTTSGAMKVKVNKGATVPTGSSARELSVNLYRMSHPSLHGGAELVASVTIKVPKNRTEPSPSPTPTECPTPARTVANDGSPSRQQDPRDCPSPEPSESPDPTPSETPDPAPSPSPSPTGPQLVLTKTVKPDPVPMEDKDPAKSKPLVTWTITVRNAGTAAYEGSLVIRDALPDVWDLYPFYATARGAMGFDESSPHVGMEFFDDKARLKVLPAANKGDPAFVGNSELVGHEEEPQRFCMLWFRAGKTLEPSSEGGEGKTSVDRWKADSFYDIRNSKRVRRLVGSADIRCVGNGRIEPGESVVVTINASRYGKTGDTRLNLAEAWWDGGSAKAKATVELDGIRSPLDDIQGCIELGRTALSRRTLGRGECSAEFGTESPDRLIGGGNTDVLLGHYGDDVLQGRAGSDMISGGVGHDEIYGNRGHDHLVGGSGKDLIKGGRGNDLLVGGPDKDRLIGGSGDDRIEARDGERDVIKCGKGKDVAIVDKKDRVRGCEKVRRK